MYDKSEETSKKSVLRRTGPKLRVVQSKEGIRRFCLDRLHYRGKRKGES